MRRNALKLLALSFAVASGIAHAGSAVSVNPGSPYVVTFYDPSGSGATVKVKALAEPSMHLTFSNGSKTIDGPALVSVGGVMGMLNIGPAKITNISGAVINEKTGMVGTRTKSLERINAAVDSMANSIKFDIDSASIGEIISGGNFSINYPSFPGWYTGGILKLNNIRVDFLTKTIYSDLISENFGATPRSKIRYQVPVWTFSELDGSTLIPIAELASGNVENLRLLGYQTSKNNSGGYDVSWALTVKNLKITAPGLAAFALAIGTAPGDIAYGNFDLINTRTEGWGALIITPKLGTVAQ